MFRALVAEGEAQDLIEYGLLATLVSLTALVALQLFGVAVGQLWTRMTTQLAGMFL